MNFFPSLLVIFLSIASFTNSGLDLREANVTNVTFEKINSTTYSFDVTLYHDDDGEEGYANFWVVETLNGTELGRRILTHAHGTQEFTRSEIITIPEDFTLVVVRGHDQTHGFGGQVIIIDLITSELEKVDQGAERLDFSERTTIIPSNSLPTSQVTDFRIDIFTVIILTFLVQYKRKNTI